MYLQENTLLQGGKYRIVRHISDGGFGCTYEAVNTTMRNRRVAIKELFVSDFCNRDPHTGNVTVLTQSKQPLFDKLRDKFLDEAEAIMDLNHSGIVRVTDFFEENGTAYYVMDYIDGNSLRQMVMNNGALSEKDALRYIRQVADALQYVHNNKRLHLDIKPANIMINGKETAILIDFGVSKQYDEASGENTSTLMGYTRGYAPVEQSNNSISKFLPATDIYALGATLYTLLTGEVPPPATEIASGEALPPLPASVSPSTRRAVMAAMNTNKLTRPQSVAEFLALLDGKVDDGATNIIGKDDNNEGKVIHGAEIEIINDTPPRRNFTWLLTVLVGIVIVIWAVMGPRGCETQEAIEETSIETEFTAEKAPAEEVVCAAEAPTKDIYSEDTCPTVEVYAEVAAVAPAEKTYQVGDYYDRNGIRGVVFEVSDGGRHGKVLSMDRGEACWCTSSQYNKNITTGASNEWNGKSNTDKILSRSDRDEYRAFVWCRNKGSNWYLPSKEELLIMYRNKEKINATLSKHGGTTLSGWYWSSTEYSGWYAWGVSMHNGNTGNGGYKNYDGYYVRAAVAF